MQILTFWPPLSVNSTKVVCYKLNFNSKELIINPHYTYASDYYSCSKLNLSENEKKQFWTGLNSDYYFKIQT